MQKLVTLVSANAHWFVIPIAILLLFPSTFMWIGFIAAVGLFMCRWLARHSPFPSTSINLPLVIFLAMVALGFAITTTPDLALATTGQLIAGVIVFFALIDYIQSTERLWNVVGVLVLLGIALALVAPFTVQWSASKLFGLPEFYDAAWPRLAKETNPNILAGALAPIVPLALAVIAQGERRWRTLGAVSLAPILVILVLLQSRGAVFGLAAGLVLWLSLYNRWVLPFVPIGILAFLVVDAQVGAVSFANLFFGETGSGTSGTLFQRQDLWIQSLFLIRQSPVLGIGLSAYPLVAKTAWPNSPARPGESANHAHNMLLQVALDTGILGVIAFVAIWLLALRAAWSSYRAKLNRHLAIGVLAAFVVLLVHSLGDVIVWGTSKSSIVLWILLAIALKLQSASLTDG